MNYYTALKNEYKGTYCARYIQVYLENNIFILYSISTECIRRTYRNYFVRLRLLFRGNSPVKQHPRGSHADDCESRTEEKDVMVKVVVNLINQRNE